MEYQLPNLIVGSITKESLYGAFENGITAEQVSLGVWISAWSIIRYSESFLFCVVFQIISFLQQNAHPRVADKIPAVTENVTDQVQLNKSMISSMDNRNCQSNWIGNSSMQIRLWETDRNRVDMTLSHLYEDFPSKVKPSIFNLEIVLGQYWVAYTMLVCAFHISVNANIFILLLLVQDMFDQCCDYARDHGCLLWEDAKKMRLIVRVEFHSEMREFLRRLR